MSRVPRAWSEAANSAGWLAADSARPGKSTTTAPVASADMRTSGGPALAAAGPLVLSRQAAH